MTTHRSFLKEFKETVSQIDQNLAPEKIKKEREDRQRRIDKEHKKNQEVFGELFSIHKRRLVRGACPTKQLDQRILWNLPVNEVSWWMNHLKAKLIDEEKGIVEYYEKVRQDGQYAGILANEFSGDNILKEEETYAEKSETTEPDWKG